MSTEEQKPTQGEDAPDALPARPRQVAGIVIATWTNSSKALIQLDSGSVVEAVGANQLRDAFEIGAEAIVFIDDEDGVLGWMLAGRDIGIRFARGGTV